MSKYLVFDIGASFIKYGLVDKNGEFIEKAVVPTPAGENGYAGIVDIMAAAIDKQRSLTAVVCSLPGIYDKRNRTVLFAPNLKTIIGRNISKDLSKIVNKPIFVENDSNMAAFGEYHYGFDRKPSSMLMLTLGTGVGGGLVIDGNLFSGRISTMEVGHMAIATEGKLCGCGKKGCMEQYCTAGALVSEYREVSGGLTVTPKELAYKVDEGDFAAYAVFDIFAFNLAYGISNLINIFNPTHIRIGGGISELAKYYLPRVKEILPDLVLPAYRDFYKLEQAKLRNDAALLGGAKWAEHLLK
jgi:glucokinase